MTLAQRQQYQSFVSVLKGGVTSEVIVNLVPVSKKNEQITVPQIFTLFCGAVMFLVFGNGNELKTPSEITPPF